MKRKKNNGFSLGFAAITAAMGLLIACQNPSGPATDPEGTGSLTVRIGFEGEASVQGTRTASPVDTTTNGTLKLNDIVSYVIDFAPTTGTSAKDHASVSFSPTATSVPAISDLAAGDYEITVIASKQDPSTTGGTFKFAAGSAKVTIAAGKTSTANITLGPIHDGYPGSLRYALTFPQEVSTATLAIGPMPNGYNSNNLDTNSGWTYNANENRLEADLTKSQGSYSPGSGEVSLPSGYYLARLSLTIDGTVPNTAAEYAGFRNESVHIYGGLESVLTAEYGSNDFFTEKAVDDLDLSRFGFSPRVGKPPQVSFAGPQYYGDIAWRNGNTDLTQNDVFVIGGNYTAEITLTENFGYSLGTNQYDAFQYGTIKATYDTQYKTITIAFGVLADSAP